MKIELDNELFIIKCKDFMIKKSFAGHAESPDEK